MRIDFFTFFKDLKNYRLNFLKKDLIAAFSVALFAIPQSIAYAALAGLPPIAGIFSAIFGTIFTSVFCSAKHMVSGPSTGVSILLQTALADVLYNFYGPNFTEDQLLYVLMHLVFMVGIIQMAAGLFNIEKILQFISRSVIWGYFIGVFFAIFINQLFPLFGVSSIQGDRSVLVRGIHFLGMVQSFNWIALLLGLFCFVFLFVFRKKSPLLPIPLFMLIAASIIAFFLPGQVDLLSLNGIKLEKGFIDLDFPFVSLAIVVEAFPSAVAIALLGIFEVFSTSRGLGAKTGENTKINQEVFAIGLSNTALSFIHGAMPASGSISRSLLNLRLGAKSRFSALFSGIFVGFGVYFAYPLIGNIPLTALAALLIAMIPSIIDTEKVKICLKATTGDAVVFILTFISCLIFRLDIAFFIGIVISVIFYLKNAADPHMVEYSFNPKGRLVAINSNEREMKRIRIIGIGGELFFGVADFFQQTLQTIAEDPFVRVIVLRLNGVYHVDASICFTLLRLHEYLITTNRYLVITGITPDVLTVFERSSFLQKIGKDNLFLTDEGNPQLSTWKGCLRAKDLITSEIEDND